jgi:uncharacterized protein YaiL (DUF2058 family)
MGNLRDELLKKGLTSEKRARAVVHEEKARQKKLSPEELAAERADREAAAAREIEERRAADRRREEERKTDAAENREGHQVESLILSGLVKDSGGNRRFYFITREQTISFLELSDGSHRGLADGRMGIVESGGLTRMDFCLVAAEQASAIARVDPERVCFLNAPYRAS